MGKLTISDNQGAQHTGTLPESWHQVPLLKYATLVAAPDLVARAAALADLVGKLQSDGLAKVQTQLQREAEARVQAITPPSYQDWLLTKLFGLTDSQLATMKSKILPAALVIGPEQALAINSQRQQAEQTQRRNTL
jgi:hypothetical protein